LRRLGDLTGRFGVTNVELLNNDEPWDVEAVDFCFSASFFSAISDVGIIDRQLRRLARCLRGIALLHFDTRPRTLADQVGERVHYWAHAARPSRVSLLHTEDAAVVRSRLTECNFQIVAEFNPGTAEHLIAVEGQ
ncbi:MAG: hypothetical protein V1723_03425, partial [Candidatus Uhrbacteria bacterium]